MSHPYVILSCDACGKLVETVSEAGSSHGAGSGLLLFVRGEERHYEEPPLCSRCSVAIGVTALVRWAEEEEEG